MGLSAGTFAGTLSDRPIRRVCRPSDRALSGDPAGAARVEVPRSAMTQRDPRSYNPALAAERRLLRLGTHVGWKSLLSRANQYLTKDGLINSERTRHPPG